MEKFKKWYKDNIDDILIFQLGLFLVFFLRDGIGLIISIAIYIIYLTKKNKE